MYFGLPLIIQGKMEIKSKTHFLTPYKSRLWKCAWLEQVTRVAPLAARPAGQLLIVHFAVKFFVIDTISGKTLTLVRGSTLDSRQYSLIFQKEKRPVGTFFFLEQVTRVELAGSSLGSCRHTARRHLHFFAP